MLIARASNGVFILGIDAENVRRLKDGKPILKALSQFGGTDDVLIMYGETLDDVQREIEQKIGPLPKAQSHPHLDDLRKGIQCLRAPQRSRSARRKWRH